MVVEVKPLVSASITIMAGNSSEGMSRPLLALAKSDKSEDWFLRLDGPFKDQENPNIKIHIEISTWMGH